MTATFIQSLRRNSFTRQLGALLPARARRNFERLLNRKNRARGIDEALAGARAGLDDIEQYILARPVPLRAPLILISQAHRSGGTLLSQLLDGHPAVAVHPHELKIGPARSEQWPDVDMGADAKTCFRLLYEPYTAGLLRRGFSKGEQDPDRRPFFLVPRIQYRVFLRLMAAEPPQNARDILDHFFTAYFNAWLNYRGDLRTKKWIAAFAPRLAHDAGNVAQFFRDYPDGLLIQIVREPKAWFASARRHGADSAAKSAEEILAAWRASAESILRNRAAYPGQVIVLRFEDLVGSSEPTMRQLAQQLGIDYDPILLRPTFNGE
ncbi:MAG TPA: sulfotransferase, partial [Xanthobacteraceae bacterium]|nr:sulfotransferase [Xanthobacteraceae bacterium]